MDLKEWKAALQQYIVGGDLPPWEDQYAYSTPESHVGKMFREAGNQDDLAIIALGVLDYLDGRRPKNAEAIERWLKLVTLAPHATYVEAVTDFFHRSRSRTEHYYRLRQWALDLRALSALCEIQGTLEEAERALMDSFWQGLLFDVDRYHWPAAHGLRRLDANLVIPFIPDIFEWDEVDSGDRIRFIHALVDGLQAKQVDPFAALHAPLATAFAGMSEDEIRRHFTDIGLADDVDKLLAEMSDRPTP